MLKYFTNIILVIFITGCSSTEMATLSLDTAAAKLFADKVIQQYSNYATASGYRDTKQVAFNLRGPDDEPVYLFRPRSEKEEITIYTFDRQDSCILYSGDLSENAYLIKVDSIPIPRGRYLLKIGERIDSLNHK